MTENIDKRIETVAETIWGLSAHNKHKAKEYLSLFIHTHTAEVLEKILGEIGELKTDERKTAEFGEWVAESYNDKMMVNAVLDKVSFFLTTALEDLKK